MHISNETLRNSQANKIHQLGSCSATSRKSISSNNDHKTLTARSFCRSVKVGLPVSFGVNDSQINFLLKELHTMKQKYSEMERQLTETSTVDKSIIEDVAISTKNLELRMSQVCLENETNKENVSKDLEKQKQEQIRHCEEIIQTLSEATAKINILESKNGELSSQNQLLERSLLEQKTKNKKIQKQSSVLMETIDEIENGKSLIIEGIGHELEKLRGLKLSKENSSILSHREETIEYHNDGDKLKTEILQKKMDAKNEETQVKSSQKEQEQKLSPIKAYNLEDSREESLEISNDNHN